MRARRRAISKYLVVMLALLFSAALVSGPIWAAATPGAQTAKSNSISKAQAVAGYGRLPLFFTENQGQIDSQVKFFTRGKGHAIFFTPEGMVLSLSRASDEVKRGGKAGKGKKGRQALVQLRPLGINPGADILATEPLPGKVNYLQGNDPTKWQTNVPTYKSVLYREAYKGVDLKFYGVGQQVEYDLIVKPGADPKQVKFLYQGIKALKVTKNGDLTISLPGGGKLVQKSPVIYQEIDGQRIAREGKFRVLPGTKNRGYGFELASYDARYPLIIDPVILVYSTFLGGTTWESGNAIAVDASGSAYVAGSTQSLDFPVTPGAAQSVFGGDPEDAFVAKFNPAGSALVYATYLGGNDDDIGLGIAVDAAGNAYVAGETFSTDFPRLNAFQNTLRGINNAFFTKLNAAGALAYSTYIGGSTDATLQPGSGSDIGKVIAVDSAGNAYMAGDTSSTDFPVANALQATLNGAVNTFVTKFNPTQVGPASLVYSTYLGGNVSDAAWGIAVDATGAAYVAGETQSSTFPVTDASTIKGPSDAFITKLNPTGGGPVYSKYWGGTGSDYATGGIAIDAALNAYISGNTDSLDFTLVTPFQATMNGSSNAFVTKFDPVGTAVYSTYLGGSGTDTAWFTAVDSVGCAYVTGETSSADFPINSGFQYTLPGANNAFITKFTPLGNLLQYSTFLGGNTQDFGFGIVVDAQHNAYVTGFSESLNFPLKAAIKITGNALGSAFVTKLTTMDMPPIFILLDLL